MHMRASCSLIQISPRTTPESNSDFLSGAAFTKLEYLILNQPCSGVTASQECTGRANEHLLTTCTQVLRRRANMIGTMTTIAAECIRQPGRTSMWSKAAGRYVCSKDPEFNEAVKQNSLTANSPYPPINPAFKLVFITAAAG